MGMHVQTFTWRSTGEVLTEAELGARMELFVRGRKFKPVAQRSRNKFGNIIKRYMPTIIAMEGEGLDITSKSLADFAHVSISASVKALAKLKKIDQIEVCRADGCLLFYRVSTTTKK